MSKEILVDGMLSGTGVRDALDGGYLDPMAIGLSADLTRDIVAWQRRYEDAHFAGHLADTVAVLDGEGLELTARVQDELPDKRVGYFSDARLKRLG